MNKIAYVCALILAGLPLFAQSPAPKPQSPQPITTVELQAQLAEARLEIVQLKQANTELQIQIQLAQKAALGPSLDQVRQQAQQAVQDAQQAARSARAMADAEHPKK